MFANAMEKTAEKSVFFDEFEVDLLKRKLLKRGQIVYLKPKAFDLLVTLIENRGEFLSKNELLDKVWANQFVEENNLTVHIAAIRKALGETKDNHRFIITVPGKGYRFIGELNEANDLSEVNEDTIVFESRQIQRITIETPEDQTGVKQLAGLKNHRLAWSLLISVLLLAVGFGGYFWLTRRKSNVFAASASQNFSIKRLTTDGKATNTSLSADGKLFVYSHVDGVNQSLWLGHVDGGEAIQLRPPAPLIFYGIKFAPDDSGIYYSTGDGQTDSAAAIYKIPVFGGAAEKIADGVRYFTFAPDGKRFAFVRNDPARGRSILLICDAADKNETELAASTDKMNFASSSASWSPDGSTISIGASKDESRATYDLLTISVADGAIKTLTAQNWGRITATVWLADGSGLVAVAQKKDSLRVQPWLVASPNGEVQPLITDLNLYGSTVSLSSNQNSLLTMQEQVQSNIWTAPTDNLANAKQITFGSIGRIDGGYGLEWTTDGRIVYTADVDGNNTIWTMNADGSGQKQLIPSDGNTCYPSVTADARYVVFESNRNGKYAVWRANSDGSDLRQLTDTDVAAQPNVSPDGQWIIYVTNFENSGELRRISIDGGEPLKLADGASWARISPDSRFVAYGYSDGGKTKIAVISIDGGQILKSFDVPRLANIRSGIHWTPDGKAITYRDWVDGIWQQNLEAGEPQRLKGLPHEKLYCYNWSPDGKQFAFTRETELRDVIIINNFR